MGNPPITSPDGDPTDDRLNLLGPPNSILVINSGPFGSKAAQIQRTDRMPATVLECIIGGRNHNSGIYRVAYRAYSVLVTDVPELITLVKSTDGLRAFEFVLRNGQYHLHSGSGSETLVGSYAANVIHSISFQLNMDTNTFRIILDGIAATGYRPFLDAAFNDIRLLRFEYPPPLLEALPGTYVIDDILITK